MRGKVLLGWLAREEAVKYLREYCSFRPTLTEQAAEALWAEKKAAVDALEPRIATSPPTLEMTPAEREAANRFLSFMRKKPGGLGMITDVVKQDPRGLVLRQFDINLDRANEHAVHIEAATWCARNCLATERADANLNYKAVNDGWNFSLPHGEFALGWDGRVFSIVLGGPHVAVSALGTRTILWTGYHRCYARMATVNPAIRDRSVLAALTVEGTRTLGPDSTNQPLRALVLGDRPALLGDFLDERLFIEVEIPRKQYELQIRCRVVPSNVN
jgi:hypothetical protein